MSQMRSLISAYTEGFGLPDRPGRFLEANGHTHTLALAYLALTLDFFFCKGPIPVTRVTCIYINTILSVHVCF